MVKVFCDKPRRLKDVWIAVLCRDDQFYRYFRAGVMRHAKELGLKRIWLTNEDEIRRIERESPDDLDSLSVIGHVWDHTTLLNIVKARVPCVLTNISNPNLRIKRIRDSVALCSTDNAAVGRMAADYFLKKGRFRHFAFAGVTGDPGWQWWSDMRFDGFSRALAKAGHRADFHNMAQSSFARGPRAAQPIDASWLKDSHKPLAVFAANDEIARDIVTACTVARIRIPEDVAILGVDNNPLICATATIGISSIAMPIEWLGYEALSILGRMLRGERLGGRTILCPPSHIEERQTTRAAPVHDAFVTKALAFIETNASRDLTVPDVVAVCGASRRYVEQRFKLLTDRTVLETIHEARLARVCDLLRGSDDPINFIAAKTGYTNVSGLCTLFKRRFGIGMREYRAKARIAGLEVS